MTAAVTTERPELPEKRADIQGLRGLAVLAVVAFHASRAVLPGGFAGVDIFFVISGFLITKILLGGLEGERLSLLDFYRHRVRRLFPALYVVIAATLLAGVLILPPKLLKELVFTQFSTSLFLSNFAFARLAGYFDSAASLKPLLHTWSLGVEEQFYLFYPVILLAVWKFLRRHLWAALAVLALLSFGLAEWSLVSRPEAGFYLPQSRAFELLIGSLCVGVERRFAWSDTLRRWLSVAGLLLVVVSVACLNASLPFPGLFALPPCIGTALLLVTRGGFGGRLLAAPPLVHTGDMSYSLYLWHWPLLVFARLILGDHVWVTLVCILVAFAAAYLSRRFIELPFLEGRVRRVWLWGGIAMAVSIVAALVVFQANGLPDRFNAREQAAFAAADAYDHDRGHCHLAKDRLMDYARTCVYGDPHADPSVAVWGDSHGAELSMALGARLAPQHLALRQITASACPPSVGFDIRYNRACREHNADTLAHLKADSRIKTVILTANYLRYGDEQGAAMLGGLEISALELQNAGKQVVIIYPLPVYAFDPPSQAGLAIHLGRDPHDVGMSRADFERDNHMITAELDGFTAAHGILPLRPADVLCDATTCRVYDDKAGVLYFNGQHLNLAGAGLLADRLDAIGGKR